MRIFAHSDITHFTGIQAKELLNKAVLEDSVTFKTWTPRRVGTILSRYGFSSNKSNGKKLFVPDRHKLRRVEESYGFDLEST